MLVKPTILVIDDEPDFLESVRGVLEREGYHVETAMDGQTGLHKVHHVHPNLILLDIVMPGMDGYELLRHVTREHATSQIPVVMLTARGESESVFKSQELGAMDYLIKPFKVDELLKVLRHYTL